MAPARITKSLHGSGSLGVASHLRPAQALGAQALGDQHFRGRLHQRGVGFVMESCSCKQSG